MLFSLRITIFAVKFNRTMKKFLVIALLFFAFQLQAQVRIGETEAFATAKLFMQQQAKQQNILLSLNEVIGSKDSGQANLFVFTMNPRGFVIVSATNEVLAYSLVNVFPTSNELPDHIAYWLDLYNDQTDYLLQHPEQQKVPSKNQNTVEPLLTVCWGQGCYHNAACPTDVNGPCHHVSAGCVALAMAQIMYYHQQPTKGSGTLSYSCPPYGNLSANFENTQYQWEEMADTIHENNPAVAKLIYHCGISVKMQYGANLSLASSSAAATAFRQNFFYPTASLENRTNYSNEEWLTMVKENLDNQQPLYYAGASNLGGHAFVCDGYDENGLFHFNFGWDGVADGYYTLDAPYGFSVSQNIIQNISPAIDIPINGDEHGIIYVSPDGTGDGSSWAQATRDLQSAIFKSHLGDYSIWVKEGTYTGDPKEKYAFSLLQKSNLYGGFKGDEPYDYDLSMRDFEAHPTVLDGNHTQGVVSVTAPTGDHTSFIDGFTIQNGNAPQGSGILTSNTILLRNCKLCHNYTQGNGGGLSNHTSSESILVEDCAFFDNEAKRSGGAVNNSGNAIFSNCWFYDNRAGTDGGAIRCNSNGEQNCFTNCIISNNTAQNGGGIACSGQKPVFWNCLISNNTAETGGGCHFRAGEAYLFNCTIVKNEAIADFGGVYTSNSTQNSIRNCIIWGNVSQGETAQIDPMAAYLHCAVQDDKSELELNFDANAENDGDSPGFYVRFSHADVTAGNTGQGGDWRLQSNSLCIDRVDSIAGQPSTDLGGNPRIKHNRVDLGAYESNTVSHVINAITCEDDPFEYNGTPFPNAGCYSFLHQGIAYDSLVVLQLHTTTVQLEKEICEGDTYDFFGTMLNEAGHYSAMVNCKNYELDLTVKPLPTVYMEEEICEGGIYDFFGTLLSESGHYSTSLNCKAYELDLTVKPEPTSFIEMQQEICEGETYNFFGKHLSSEGRYYHSDSDCNTYELELTVNPMPVLHCTNDTTIEYGNPLQLYASGADSYLWSTGDTTQYITVTPKENKTYFVTGFSQHGCKAMTSVKVQISKGDQEEQLVLFPNPANDKVVVVMPLIDEVEILNLFGQPITRMSAHREAVEIDVSRYANGVYIVHVREMQNHSYKKLIIKH